jgi:hypothetical protein
MTNDQRTRIEDAANHYAAASQVSQQEQGDPKRWYQAETYRTKMWNELMAALDEAQIEYEELAGRFHS